MVCTWPISLVACSNTDPLENLGTGVGAGGFDEREFVEKLATDFLWNWTNRAFGLCTETLRPCRERCPAPTATDRFMSSLVDGSYSSQWKPVLLDGRWFNLTCGSCTDSCGCRNASSIRLPSPTHEVTEVRIDGEVIPESSWTLVNKRILVRTDGEGWPFTQNLSLPNGAIGTFEVDILYGEPVPPGGQIAAGILAVEFAKALCNDNTCQLPKRLSSITRQGVTATFMDTFDDIGRGGTGIWLVDSWVASVTKPARGGQVYSVDVKSRAY